LKTENSTALELRNQPAAILQAGSGIWRKNQLYIYINNYHTYILTTNPHLYLLQSSVRLLQFLCETPIKKNQFKMFVSTVSRIAPVARTAVST